MTSPKPHVLFINMASGYGGGEVQTEVLISLSAEHYECYFYGKQSGKIRASLQSKNINVKILNFWQCVQLARRHSDLIVHTHDGRGAHVGYLLKCLTACRLIITRRMTKPLKRGLSTLAYRKADCLVGVSQQIAAMLRPLNSHTRVVYGGVNPSREDIEFEQHYFSLPHTRLRVAHVGNLQPVKNFELTIKLAALYPQIEFYIVGSGVLESSLKEQAKELANVFFIPFTPFVGSVFKNVDLQILPSLSEGLGVVILEGYRYGVPVMANHVGGIPEIVLDGETGILVENNLLEGYCAFLDKIQRHELDLQKLSQQARAFMVSHDFTKERMAREYWEIYQQLLSSR